MQPITIERISSVSERIGLRRSSIYKLISSGELRPVKITGRAVGFLSSEIDEFIERRASLRVQVKTAANAGVDRNEGGGL